MIGVIWRTTADGKYAPVENGQDTLVFILVFTLLVAVLHVVFRGKR